MFPIPPAAYWDKVPWWAYFILILVVGGFLPFLVKVIMSGQSYHEKRDQRAFASQQMLDTHRDAFLHTLQEDRDNARDEARRERELRQTIEENRDMGWDLARGSYELACNLRHNLISVGINFNIIRNAFLEVIQGNMSIDRARLLVEEIPPFESPLPIPPLQEGKRKKPA